MAKPSTKKAPADEADTAKDRSVHSFAMHQPEQVNLTPGFDRIAKIFAGRISTCLEPIVGEKLSVEPKTSELISYADWVTSKPEFSGLTKFLMPPCKGTLLLGVEPVMISSLVDSFYGGGTEKPKSKGQAFTRMEAQLHSRVAHDICAALAQSWAIYGRFDVQVSGHETDPAYAGLAGEAESVLRQILAVSFADKRKFEIELLYSMDAVRSLEILLEPSAREENETPNPVWRYELENAIREVQLPVRSVLARTTMTLPQIAELKPGDIIPIPAARNLPLIIGEKVFARGNLGEQDGCAAYQIEKMERGSEL